MTSQRTRDRLVKRLRDEGVCDERVLQVIGNTPRHIFVDEALASRAYEDTALPIGHGQTISQPYIVARMTEAVMMDGVPERVLEIGTGSGYQTAILAQLSPRIFSVERIQALSDLAKRRFELLGLRNIRLKYSDGTMGWSEQAPFDAIVVTAAPLEVPQGLVEQLGVGGRLVIPVGPSGDQILTMIKRTREGFETTELERVSFVPLLGGRS
ncbi:protein-L-isoaspartate O-methyltransferase [Solemya pervernicosa gill symbiont]|uniref:Protein-L-isoaspartate O-methyltransferase n=3 Tax=Gammaproteobacteria incertae sedis TaxID=118884 RepID=A0A1T2L805_9GAMM|nr:protein-L-isoaspartate O-methyltransferase [Solemya pervernicosa gill symbiont]QKQ28267.1 protein-L-isoaspartate(D-aspartate) O-methyltransferase [Candidatus Reidiella endopervernicosa]